ncbi:putative butyrate kinase [Bacteroidia bacterium]|nr:putative butyrate kinase [Bacteroidia bacterium]GHT80326.1 putative butyrate kinase [Bacteroidia bacterium]
MLLAINPGSTSTKIAVFEGNKNVFQVTLRHSSEEIAKFATVADQYVFRKEIILQKLQDAKINIQKIDVVVGRGGIVKPVESGVYEVNDALKDDLRSAKYGEHASNLGAIIADDIAKSLPKARAFIADPVVVDELQDVARITGLPSMQRISIFHALNQKAIARTYAKEVGKPYESLNLIIAHMGGGITIGAHLQGKVVDVNNAIDGDGPFSPERSGALPPGQLVELCFAGTHSKAEIKKLIAGKGGLVAHLNSNDMQTVAAQANGGDAKAKLVADAMAYQVGKSIGAAAAVLHGKVDAILLTGGIAYNDITINYIKTMVTFIAPVRVYPGEDEMGALAGNVNDALKGIVPIKKYA